ncbi:MAG TPA: YcgN family cysteine cluster protein [Hyphomicrobiaceae bacterium]|nr:YcgN family cysteine cluster protein [Hyphomicrobiaceae bacterium]
MTDLPFWTAKPLEALSADEWEQLCDGCGRCCLLKLEDDDTGAIHLTRLACRLLDISTCRCSDYENRHRRVADCLSITPRSVRELAWLPETCGYRRVAEGRELAWWHPLVSGSTETVHEAGISVRTLARSETGVRPASLFKYIIDGYPAAGPR